MDGPMLDNIADTDSKYIIKLPINHIYNYYDIRDLLPIIHTFSQDIKRQIISQISNLIL